MNPVILDQRRKFTIRCTPDCGVVIEDGNGKKNGNFRGKNGKTLSWKNETNQSVCYLRFTRIPDENSEETMTGNPSWPFQETAPPDLLLEVPQGGWTTRTLKMVEVTESFEYDVLGTDKAPLLDPVIIIDPN